MKPEDIKADPLKGRLIIQVTGTVQGVGFRPFVYALAKELQLTGFVANTARGVTIDIEGISAIEFLKRLQSDAPPLAHITELVVEQLPLFGYHGFRIIESTDAGGFTMISPDVATCNECTAELLDPHDRRHRYPFINCTNCGPRYSITRAVPYDRPNTTMDAFIMCPACESEYTDPEDRRFHAVPNACPDCGPHVELFVGESRIEGDSITRAGSLLRAGKVIAIKGIGGFHLACDATSHRAVGLLRERKRKSNKPFALMARNADEVRQYCELSEDEEAHLLSPRRPVVLLRKRTDCALPEALAPNNLRLGFMLSYTPLHHLIMEEVGRPLVMTSGNLSEEPIQKDNGEVREKLASLADAFLTHDRDIFMRVDDSVLKVGPDRRTVFIRRSRGYAPEPILLGDEGPDVLAVGADIKNTFAITKGSLAMVSQHIGDMENYETLRFFEETIENLKSVYRAVPVALAHDMHPGYLSTQWALKQDIKKLAVQHHHAHIASVMATKGIRSKVVGIALDGTGYGPDGTLWGGEFLIVSPTAYVRAGHLAEASLPGGERAVREPWRMAISHVLRAVGKAETLSYLDRAGLVERYGAQKIADIIRICSMPEVSPVTTGAGRLFDAVSALLGICDESTFEGEAAMTLEAEVADDVSEDYPVNIGYAGTPARMVVDFSYVLVRIINDVRDGIERPVLAARFHNTMAEAAARVAIKLASQHGIQDVVLSGGVMQNDILRSRLTEKLRKDYLNVHINEHVPLNDGGIALGQAFILRESMKAGIL